MSAAAPSAPSAAPPCATTPPPGGGLTRVTVKLGRGRGLVSRDRNGLSDPYCIIYVGNKERKFKTDVHSATLAPALDVVHELLVDVKKQPYVVFKVKDHDKVAKNESMGIIMVPIAGLPTAEQSSGPRRLDLTPCPGSSRWRCSSTSTWTLRCLCLAKCTSWCARCRISTCTRGLWRVRS